MATCGRFVRLGTRRAPVFLAGVLLACLTAPPARAQQADAPPEAESEVQKQALGGDLDPVGPAEESAEGAAVRRTLRVGAAGSAPFVVERGEQLRGLSLEVWQEVARLAGLEYELVPVEGVEPLLERVAAGDLDVAVGPISITSDRAEHVRFTQPYFQASLAILATTRALSMWDRLGGFLTKAFFAAVGMLLLVLVGVGTLFWLIERKKNPDMFPASPVRGIGVGMWLALVTMTTVGYGDKVPVSTGGRVVAGVWMIVSMLTVSSLTAGLATAFTLSQLDEGRIATASQLPGRRIAVVRDTVGAEFAQNHEARVLPQPTLEGAVQKVLGGEAEAVVHDRPMLQYYLARHPEAELQLSESMYEPQGYGFATQTAELRHQLTVALLRAAEGNRVDVIAARWLERPSDEAE